MRIAVSSYSFNQALHDKRMTLLDVIPKAKQMGFDGVEITDVGATFGEMRDLAGELNRQSQQYGLPIVAYLVGADFLKNDLDQEVNRLKEAVDTACLMGAKMLRHDAAQGVDSQGNPVPFEEALPRLAEGYLRVTQYAAGKGIRTMIENHGFYAQDSSRVKALVERVGHPNFGWLVDIGNFLCADECPVDAVNTAAPYAVHVHAKDFHLKDKGAVMPNQGWFKSRGENLLRGAIVGHGVIDVAECIKILKRAGYDQWISIEFEGMEDCLMAIEESRINLIRSL